MLQIGSKSSQLYLYSAFNNTDCVKALNSIKLEDRVSVMYNDKIKYTQFSVKGISLLNSEMSLSSSVPDLFYERTLVCKTSLK